MSRYSAVAQMNRFQPQFPKPFIHQGALTQSTDRIPEVAKIEMSRYAQLDSVRLIPGARVEVHQGAIIQTTEPIQVFGKPNLSQWPGRQYPGVSAQLPSVAAPQSYPSPLFDIAALGRYRTLEQVRLIPGAIPQFSGATIQRTDPIPVFGNPMLARYPQPQYPGVAQQVNQATVPASTDLPLSPARDDLRAWWAIRETVRGFTAVAPQLITFPAGSGGGGSSEWGYAEWGVTEWSAAGNTQVDVSTRLNQARYYETRQYPPTLPPTPQTPALPQPTYIFPQPQPNLARWPGRQYAKPGPQVTGTPQQQTHIFPQQQPNLTWWPGRQYPRTVPQLTQAAAPVAHTYIFPQPQPMLSRWPGREYPNVARQFLGSVPLQESVFHVAQPELSRYAALSRYIERRSFTLIDGSFLPPVIVAEPPFLTPAIFRTGAPIGNSDPEFNLAEHGPTEWGGTIGGPGSTPGMFRGTNPPGSPAIFRGSGQNDSDPQFGETEFGNSEEGGPVGGPGATPGIFKKPQ